MPEKKALLESNPGHMWIQLLLRLIHPLRYGFSSLAQGFAYYIKSLSFILKEKSTNEPYVTFTY